MQWNRFKRLIILVMAVLISGWFTFQDLNFVLRGQQTTGKVTSIQVTQTFGSRNRKRSMKEVGYQFQDAAGTTYNATDSLRIHWEPPADGILPVQYIPGLPMNSRIARSPNYLAMIAFLGCTIWLGSISYFTSRNNRPR